MTELTLPVTLSVADATLPVTLSVTEVTREVMGGEDGRSRWGEALTTEQRVELCERRLVGAARVGLEHAAARVEEDRVGALGVEAHLERLRGRDCFGDCMRDCV